MAASLASILVRLLRLRRQSPPAGTCLPFPEIRHTILDVLAEGRRKNIIHLLLHADITSLRAQLARYNAGDQHLTLTACIATVFARAVDQDRSLQAYRLGADRVMVFAEVDVALMIERTWAGVTLPVVHILRGANRKDARQLHQEIQAAKTTQLGQQGPLSSWEQRFFAMPRVLRRIVWWIIRRDPALFKQLAGTVGITSVGMHSTGAAVILPITPMTLTLSIGAIETRPTLVSGRLVEREFLWLNLAADHDLVDGAPLMRFGERLKTALKEIDISRL